MRAADLVPARVGGVDLSWCSVFRDRLSFVPARVGGVDLSLYDISLPPQRTGPRPCGRGGFKLLDIIFCRLAEKVPARVGGVDLSSMFPTFLNRHRRPRPCGRGGFKHGRFTD